MVFGSFYWRLGISFVLFVLAVLVAQSVMFSYILAGTNARNPSLSPNNLATSAAAEVGAALTANPDLHLGPYLTARYGREPWPVFVVMSDGSVSSNSTRPLSDDIRRSAQSALRGTGIDRGSMPAPEGPVVTAPIQVGGELRGLVVLPPPPPGGVLRDVGRLLSLPGTIVLMIATLVAVVVIFAPARRRLSALEHAAERLGAGDLTARAPGEGGDEIARVSRAFNRMAEDLAARDEALRASDRLRRQMLADVSHELKTPLTAMRGYVETLRMAEVALDEGRRAKYLETIESETLRLDRIVKDLLDLARYENNVVPLDVRVFDVARLFNNVVRRHEHDTSTRHITVTSDVEGGADQIVGDPDRIEQVVENLVTNAVRHTPEGGRIDLRAGMANGCAVLSVADSGYGIAPGELIQKVELLAAQLDGRTAYDRLAPLRVELHVRGRRALPRRGRTVVVSGVPPRDRVDACDELADAERLGEIVVCTAFQPQHLVRFRVARRQHQDWRADVRSARPGGAAQRHSVQTRQHDVENDEVVHVLAEAAQRVASVGRFFDFEPGELEVQAQQITYGELVLYDEGAARKAVVHTSQVLRSQFVFTFGCRYRVHPFPRFEVLALEFA